MTHTKQGKTINDYFRCITYLFEEMERMNNTMKEAAHEEEFAESISKQKDPYFKDACVLRIEFDQKFPLITTPSGGLQQRDFLKIIAVASSTRSIRVEYYKKEFFIFPITNLNNTKDFLDWLIANELNDKITPELFRDHYSNLAAAVGGCCCGCD